MKIISALVISTGIISSVAAIAAPAPIAEPGVIIPAGGFYRRQATSTINATGGTVAMASNTGNVVVNVAGSSAATHSFKAYMPTTVATVASSIAAFAFGVSWMFI